LEADLRSPVFKEVFATDASGARAGACRAAAEAETLERLFSMSEEKGEHVRLDWERSRGGLPAPAPSLVDHRSSAFALTAHLHWRVMFGYPFKKENHINVLELEALASLTRRLVKEGLRGQRVLVLLDSRVAVGAAATGRSSSWRINRVLRKISCLALLHNMSLELVWVPTRGNPSDAPSRGRSLKEW